MADVQPLRALRYDPRVVGGLDVVAAPPYDVIDAPMRAALAARSPFNVVEVDLPSADGGDPYLHAETTFEAWRQQGVVVADRQPALWAMTQEYVVPGSDAAAGGAPADPDSTAGSHRTLTRRGFFCRVRVEDYGEGRIRPHERTQPGPKEDRLRLTRATRANLSPIFSLFPDPGGNAWSALASATDAEPFATVAGPEKTINRLWRVDDGEAIAAVREALAGAELLIADGHHRYETARAYAEEIGGEGEHRYVLMFLCSLSDPGLTILPTHRLLTGLDEPKQLALREVILRDFDAEEVSIDEIEPPAGPGAATFGYIDCFFKKAFRLTLKDQAIAEAALAGEPPAYQRLDTAVLEAVVLRGALGMSADDVERRRGIDYAKDARDAREAIESARVDAAFFMRPTAIEQVREVAAAGESMPPKSTFFHPKIPTGLIFNPLE